MRQTGFLAAPEFALKARYEAVLEEVMKHLGVKASRVLWTYPRSDHTLITGSLTLSGEDKKRQLPDLSVYLELVEVQVMYVFWLSTVLRARLTRYGASHMCGLKSRLTFGAYTGVTVKEVIEIAPSYLEWAQDEVADFKLDSAATAALEEALGQTDDLEGLF